MAVLLMACEVKAGEKKPPDLDLSITLSSWPDYVVPGEPLRDKIKVVATNTGKKTVEVTVELILSRKKDYVCPVPFAIYCPTYKDYVLLKGGRMLLKLPPGSKEVVFKGSNATPPDTKEGIYYIGAVIDAGNMVPETNEKNNACFRKVFVTKSIPRDRKPDLVITSADVVVTPNFSPGVPVMMFMVTVENKGTGIYRSSPNPAILKVMDRDVKWGISLPVPTLMPGESVEIAAPLMENKENPAYAQRGKVHYFDITIDSGNIAEKDKTNNSYGPLETKIPELKTKEKTPSELPDLVVKDIVFVKKCVVGVILQNTGKGPVPDEVWETMDGEKAKVTLYLFDKKWSEKSIAEIDPERKLQKPGSKLVYLPGLTIRVKGRIKIVVDPLNFVKESDEKNNSKEVTLYCKRKPDLYVSRIKVIPGKAKIGENVEIKVVVKNGGKVPARATNVAIFVGNEKIPKTYPLPKLGPGGSATVIRTANFMRAEKKRVIAVVDYGNKVNEGNEKNNRKVVYFVVYQ